MAIGKHGQAAVFHGHGLHLGLAQHHVHVLVVDVHVGLVPGLPVGIQHDTVVVEHLQRHAAEHGRQVVQGRTDKLVQSAGLVIQIDEYQAQLYLGADLPQAEG